MPTLKFISGVYDADMQKYVSGVEYDGEGLVRFHAAPPSTDVGRSMANEEQMRRNLSGTPTPVNTFTIGGVVFGGPGISDGDRITIAVTSPDGSTSDDISYIYALGDTVADLLAKIQEAFDDAEDGAVTVSLVDGVITITDTVGLTDSETALVLTFVDTTPNETAWTLPTFTEDTAGVTAVTEAKATATLAFTGVGVDAQTFTVNDQTYTLVEMLIDLPGYILIGADQTATCNNIVAAIMGTTGAGTTYGTSTVAPTGVDTAVRSGTSVIFTATTAGAAANAFASTETCTNASFTNGATFTGGVDGVAEVLNVVTGAPALLVATDPAELNTALQDLDAVIGILDPAA